MSDDYFSWQAKKQRRDVEKTQPVKCWGFDKIPAKNDRRKGDKFLGTLTTGEAVPFGQWADEKPKDPPL